MDRLERFSLVWCPTCEKTQKMIFEVLQASGPNGRDAAHIVCAHCKSIVATLHAASARHADARPKRARKAREIADRAIEGLIDPSATAEERQSRKRRLLKGPKEFRDIRGKHSKSKR